MAFNTTLNLNGTDYLLLNCTYLLNQEISRDGRPSSGVHGGRITFQIASSDDTVFTEWMVDPNKQLSGKVTFYQQDSEQELKVLNFTNGYCIDYSEYFSSTGKNPMVESIVISAETIDIGNADVDNGWPGTS